MGLFTKLLLGLIFAGVIALPTLATRQGWGVGSERNANVIAKMQAQCPPGDRYRDGRCRSHRSYYGGYIGGGARGGK